MTEREKMLAGQLYLAADPELVELRRRARALTRTFNATTEDEPALRRDILHQLFGHIGETIEIEPPFRCDYGFNICVGDNFYANFGLVVLDCAQVTMGDNVLLGPNVQIYAASHPLQPEVRLTRQELAAPIAIGSNVWIGGHAIVLPGVSIGENTTIGAGSVVTKDIPANVVAVGNPCRVLRRI